MITTYLLIRKCHPYLQALEAGAVTDLDEAEVLASGAHCLCPSGNSNDFVHVLLVRIVQLSNAHAVAI